jgi:hypothetical protein
MESFCYYLKQLEKNQTDWIKTGGVHVSRTELSVKADEFMLARRYTKSLSSASFWFAIGPETVVNPFDFVTVEHVRDTKRIVMVQYSNI